MRMVSAPLDLPAASGAVLYQLSYSGKFLGKNAGFCIL